MQLKGAVVGVPLAWPHPSSLDFAPLALGVAFHLCSYLSNLSSEQAQSKINSHVTRKPHCFDNSEYDKKVYYTAMSPLLLGNFVEVRHRMEEGRLRKSVTGCEALIQSNMSD